jgi:FG-GAP repeat protein
MRARATSSSARTPAASVDLSTLDRSNGFRLEGIDEYDRSGTSVAGAGDIHGDGIGDLIVGAPGNYSVDAGESYVVFGTAAGFAASLDLSALDGSNGFRLEGSMSTTGAAPPSRAQGTLMATASAT